jgi:hypothetical protein
VFRPGTDVRIGTRGVYAEHAYKSGSPLEVHFGLGGSEAVDIKVFPPASANLALRAVKSDRYLNLNVTTGTVCEVRTGPEHDPTNHP